MPLPLFVNPMKNSVSPDRAGAADRPARQRILGAAFAALLRHDRCDERRREEYRNRII
jgi:hypothetical protein